MNIKGKKKVNEDFIPVVYLNGSKLEYIEIDIEKKYEYLISLIQKALNEEYGELPVYYPHLEFYGQDAMGQYEYCKSKLTDEAQRMLENEEEKHSSSWREFVRYDSDKIEEESNTPSPNRPKKKRWWRLWTGWHNTQ